MGFEDSMIEDGFHDEEEYLEHLMDEAEREWESQQNEQSSYEEYEDDEEGYYEDEEYYVNLQEQYRQWAKDNPLKHQVFIAWAYFDTEKDSDSNVDNFILDKFIEWQREEDWQTERMKDYYGDFYPRILLYFEWKMENSIEELIRHPEIEYFYPIEDYPYVQEIPYRDLLVEKVENFEEWIRNKKNFDQWLSTAPDEERKEFLDNINQDFFHRNTSIENVRECLIKHLDDNKELDFIKNKIMVWYDEDGKRGRDLFYMIKCVQNFFEE